MARVSNSTTSLNDPRVRFNWGYHDARCDRERGKLRKLVSSGPQNLEYVSMSFDYYYYQGYSAGVDSPTEDNLSNNAWDSLNN